VNALNTPLDREAVHLRPIPDAKHPGYPWYNVAKMVPGVPFHLSVPVEGAWPRHEEI